MVSRSWDHGNPLGKLCLVLLSNLVQMAELFRAAGKWKTLVIIGTVFFHHFLMIFVGDIGPCLFHHGVFFSPFVQYIYICICVCMLYVPSDYLT